MTTFFTDIFNWIKTHILVTVLIVLVAVVVLFPKLVRGLFGTTRRKRYVRHGSTTLHGRRVRYVRSSRRAPRSLPRSVGLHKTKKPWQIKGSEAARRHMAKIRRMR